MEADACLMAAAAFSTRRADGTLLLGSLYPSTCSLGEGHVIGALQCRV